MGFSLTKEELLKNMTLEDKIGQLFIIPVCPKLGEEHRKEILQIIEKYRVGGILFKASDAKSQVEFLQFLQSHTPLPLLVTLDAEWGLGMRVTDGISFPRNLTLGAIQEESLLFQLGEEIGKECRAIGAHLNLAPVADVNNNPLNPIIHMRSFGENPKDVARKSLLVMKGMQKAGLLTCAKHFPGHGDTAADSHLDLPVISHSWEHLQEVELSPFRTLIDGGVDFVMSAHIYMPVLERGLLPSTLSKKVMHDLLRERLGFKGLTISDALNMKALSKHFSYGEIALLAYQSGQDFLLYGAHLLEDVQEILHKIIPSAFSSLLAAFQEGILDEKELDRRVFKILSCKEKLEVSTVHLAEVQSSAGYALKKRLYEEAVTLVRNDGNLPLKDDQKIPFIRIRPGIFPEENALKELGSASQVVVYLQGLQPFLPQYGISSKLQAFLEDLRKQAKVTLILLGTPYALNHIQGDSIIVAYEEDEYAEAAARAVLFGKKNPRGKLPVTCGQFPAGTGSSYDWELFSSTISTSASSTSEALSLPSFLPWEEVFPSLVGL